MGPRSPSTQTKYHSVMATPFKGRTGTAPDLFTPGYFKDFAAEISHFKDPLPGELYLFRPGRDNPDHRPP